MRAVRDGYEPSSIVTLVTIDFAAASAEDLAMWTDWYFATLRTQNFVLEQIPPGWYGEVFDTDTEDSIEGATFSLVCEGQSGRYNFPGVSTNADGEYEISQAQFETAMNHIGCYYNNDPFYVNVTASFEGYLDATITEYDVDPSNMGEAFDLAVTRDFDMVPDPALNYAEGDGTQENPFIIDNKERLNAINYFDDQEGLYFALSTDIVLDEDQNRLHNFDGHFDGRGHSITGATQPVFGQLESESVVKNLTIDADIAVSGSSDIGILAATASGAYIENVHTSGSVYLACSSACFAAGGLVGRMTSDSQIYRSSSSATIGGQGNDYFYFGGLVGQLNNSSIVESYATGDIISASGSGGLVGGMSGTASLTYIRDSYSTGDVSASGQAYSTAGGLVGDVEAGTILRSYSTGNVYASTTPSGGLVGNISGDETVVANSFTVAEVVVGDGYVGGAIGSHYAGVARNLGWVVRDGLSAVGYVYEDTACALDSEKNTLAGVGDCNYGADFSSLAQLKENGFNGGLAPVHLDAEDSWDFEGIWGFSESVNNGLPFLRWAENIDEEEETPASPQPERRSRSGGSFVAMVTAAVSAETMVNMMSQLKSLLTTYQSLGGVLTAAMRSFLGETTTPASASGVRDLQVGDQGEDVRALQVLLIAQGHPIPAGATGYFASQTQNALAEYQSKHGIVPAVGYFGVTTQAQMKSASLEGLWW